MPHGNRRRSVDVVFVGEEIDRPGAGSNYLDAIARTLEGGARRLSLSGTGRSSDAIDDSALCSGIDVSTESIWFTLNSPRMIAAAACYGLRASNPYGVIVWDDPRYLAVQSGRGQGIWGDFEAAIGSADAVICVSHAMLREYRPLMADGSHAAVLPFCASAAVWELGDRRTSAISGGMRPAEVIFAGSMYARREWVTFARAARPLVRSGELSLTHVGQHSRKVRKRSWVQYRGLQPANALDSLLSGATYGYLPYWFSKRDRVNAQLAFPSKLSLYTAASLPILYHGPRGTAAAEFIQKHSLGVLLPEGCIETRGVLRDLAEYMPSVEVFRAGRRDARDLLGSDVSARRFAALCDALSG